MKLLNTSHIAALLRLSLLILPVVFTANGTNAAEILVAAGAGPGHAPIVNVTLDSGSAISTLNFSAYPRTFQGGVRVAVGDVNGDGTADIVTAPGAGFASQIKVFDGRSLGRRARLLMSFNAYPGFFRGGVYVAVGDINNDGSADIIVAPDRGAPGLVRVFDGRTGDLLSSFLAYQPGFIGGVRVAAGDVNNDGHADIVTGPGAGGGPNVKVFDGLTQTLVRSFFAYTPEFTGGVFVGAGDVNGDGKADIITGTGAGVGPHVKVFDGVSNQELASFFAYDAGFTGGVRVGAGDVNGDGLADIITGAGLGGGPHVKVFSAVNLDLLHSFFAFEADYLGGVFVAGNSGAIRRR